MIILKAVDVASIFQVKANIDAVRKEQSTPMMDQYTRIKSEHMDCLLFFRMGDFFEMFFDDAREASKILNIALTTRGKHLGEDIPMCGVPHHSADFYISKLVRANKKIAICEQMESPSDAKKRGSKSIVRREVIRVITHGTLLEDELIGESRNNFLVSVVPAKPVHGECGCSLAIVDISTGDFFCETIQESNLSEELARYNPGEIISPQKYAESNVMIGLRSAGYNLSILPSAKFNPMVEVSRIKDSLGVAFLDGIANFSNSEVSAIGSLLEYIKGTQKGEIKLGIPKKIDHSEYMEVKSDTVRNLGVWQTDAGSASLFSVINATKTAMGRRMLSSRLAFPITNAKKLGERLDSIEFFITHQNALDGVLVHLAGCCDFERAMSRVNFMRASLKDVAAISDAIGRYSRVLKTIADSAFVGEIGEYLSSPVDFSDLKALLDAAIPDEFSPGDDTYIKTGYNIELDRMRSVKSTSEETIRNLQNHYITETGISNLKIRRNNLIGWFVEIPVSQKLKIPEEFIWKQTISNSVRYTTLELDELQQTLVATEDKVRQLELELFNEILTKVKESSDKIQFAAKTMAILDVSTSLAVIAIRRNFSRPSLVEDVILDIRGGRHPVVESVGLDGTSSRFTPNDCVLDDERGISIITGPNMAGKSTYLRQNAIIVLLAHIGSFVPAISAKIGLVDKLFSRIGASDDLASGKSTFMVEMIETAAILNQSTNRSFVILDEVGRGTATFDGLSIAFGVVEHIYNYNKCRTLFATHYHELAQLRESLPDLRYQTLSVKEERGNVMFEHMVEDGVADKSYGIHVAKLAGVPGSVIDRAKQILAQMESGRQIDVDPGPVPIVHENPELDKLKDVAKRVESLDPNLLTPREALNILYDLKQSLK